RVCETTANEMHVPFINITPATRNAADDTSLLAADLLHYSGKAHLEWAEQVADTIRQLAHK
ncbi:MAG TPA: SGNH/GDSL hydrolase family protein, partial [Sediminibacterium sp.]